jgi:RND family efflux transporter MFP subunit
MNRYTRTALAFLTLLAAFSLGACGKSEDAAPASAGPRPTLITATQAEARLVQRVEHSIGQVESKSAPRVAAEVDGRVTAVAVDVGQHVAQGDVLARLDDKDLRLGHDAAQAETRRLEALIASQGRQVERLRDMVKNNFTTESVLEDAIAQLKALQEQLKGAQARLAMAQRNLERTVVRAPVGGQVEQRSIDAGDYVKAGTPVFQLATRDLLRVQIPFPETLATRLRTGLVVELISPTAPDSVVQGRVSEILPMIGSASRAVMLVAEVRNPGDWQPGSSVNAQLILEEYPDAVTVPETSVVRRPAGEVVYVIRDGKAQQRRVSTGVRRQGQVQILEGLAAGETVAVDGASYLTDQAPVTVQEPRA